SGSASALDHPDTAHPAFTPDLPGTYTLALIVTDQSGHASLAGSANVIVTTCGNAAPTIGNLQATPAAPNAGATAQLQALAIDPDNSNSCAMMQSLTYSWTIVSQPTNSNAHIQNPTTLNPSIQPDLPGAYVLSLVVTDSTGRMSAAGNITVTASGCGAAPP